VQEIAEPAADTSEKSQESEVSESAVSHGEMLLIIC